MRTAGGLVVCHLELCQENRCVFEAAPECSSYSSGKPVKRGLQSVEFPTLSTPPDTRQFCFLACLGTGRSSSQASEGSKGLQAAGAAGSRCSQLQRSVRPVGGSACRGHKEVNLHILVAAVLQRCLGHQFLKRLVRHRADANSSWATATPARHSGHNGCGIESWRKDKLLPASGARGLVSS